MPTALLADVAISISELKRHPTAALDAGHGHPVAILNHNTPTHYAVPASAWEGILDALEDVELNRICDERAGQRSVKVALDDL
jgi:antitoxin StbD